MGDFGIFGPGTEAGARNQRKPTEGGCGAEETVRLRGDPEGRYSALKPREDGTLVEKIQPQKAVR